MSNVSLNGRSVIVVAGTSSGVGKTTVSCGLMASFARRGLIVQPFKVGPDFLDGKHHESAVTSGTHAYALENNVMGNCRTRKCINLDGWMMGSTQSVLESFERHANGADVCVVEGVMGLFDGRDGSSDDGSTAQIAKLLNAPVILVVDASMMARSVAAMVLGYTIYDSRMRLGGVIVNKVGGINHKTWIGDSLERDSRLIDVGTGKRVLFAGALPTDKTVSVPERHLGLHMPSTDDDKSSDDHIRFLKLALLMEENLTLDSLLTLGQSCNRQQPVPTILCPCESLAPPPLPRCRIGIAQDAAFCFYYDDNLHLLRLAGAELVPFSPISTQRLPSALDALYIGGGYPELHANDIEQNVKLRADIHSFAKAGGAILAECGGLMYLSDSLLTAASDPPRKMCGVIPDAIARMTPHMKMYYAEIEFGPKNPLFPAGTACRGQKFHFSEVTHANNVGTDDEHTVRLDTLEAPMFVTPQTPGAKQEPAGYTIHNIVASYLHLHFASNPTLADSFVESAITHSPYRRFFAVSFVSAATEIIFALKAEDTLGGVTSICDYPPEAQCAPRTVVCHSSFDCERMTSEEVDVEMRKLKQRREESGGKAPPGHWIIDTSELQRLSPRVAFVQNTCDICDPAQDDVLAALVETRLVGGIKDICKVIPVAPTTLEELFTSIQDVASALDCTKQGVDLQKNLSQRLQRIESVVSTLHTRRPRVLSLEGLAPLCTGGHWLPDMKWAAGCEDALGDTGGASARILSWEDITLADPDVLVISPCSATPNRTMRELHLLASAPSFWKLRCVQQGEVYVFGHGKFSRPGPRLIDGIEMLATLLRNVPIPPGVEENGLWKGEAFKYHCFADETCYDPKIAPTMHCTPELALRFLPCFGRSSGTTKGRKDTENNAQAKSITVSNDLKRYSVTRCTIPSYALPTDRSAHCLVSYIDTSSLILFGGEDAQGKRLCDVWKLSAPSKGWPAAAVENMSSNGTSSSQLGRIPTWEYIKCGSVANENVPTPRSNSASVVCGDHLLVFGGWGVDNMTPLASCEVLHLDSFCWTHCSTKGNSEPPPRGNPTLVYSKQNHFAILFGGWNASHRFNDLWCLDMKQWQWKKISQIAAKEQKKGSWPKPRTDHTAVLWEKSNIEEIMLVYGGSVDGEGSSSELWALNCSDSCPEDWHWYELDVGGPLPPTRTSHTAAIVGKGDSAAMVVVGGTDSSLGGRRGSMLHDAWILSLAPQRGGEDNTRGNYYAWSKLDWKKSAGIERCRHGMAVIGSTIVIWGGYDGEAVVTDDTSIWLNKSLAPTSGAPSPPRSVSADTSEVVEEPALADTSDSRQRRHLQERWEAEVPMRQEDLPRDVLTKAKNSTLPGAMYKAIHRHAVSNKRDTYIDPASGYSVFSRLYLKRRPCCGNGCRHCPHGYINVPNNKKDGSSCEAVDDLVDLDW